MIKEFLLNNLSSIHTTEKGMERIKRNLFLKDHVIEFCIEKIKDKDCFCTQKGKNFYCKNGKIIITIHSKSFTIITAHNGGK